jgi:hypothetical protein
VIVARDSSYPEVYVWENGVVLQSLILPGALATHLNQHISSDGNVITLQARPDGTGEWEILRWTQDGGFTSITGPPGEDAGNRPSAISADGSVIVGRVEGVGAYRWTEATGIVGIGGSRALGVSADGSVAAGLWRPDATSEEPFRWSANTGFVGLEDLPDFPYGRATDVPADGTFLLGRSYYSNGAPGPGPIQQDAWLWSEQTGTRRLVDILINDHNLDMGDIGVYTEFIVADISDDSRVLVGFLERPSSTTDKGWVAILDRPLFTLSCDFNFDGFCDIDDIDSLVMEIAAMTNDPDFDLNGDGFVDLADRDEWLAAAGAMNLPSGNPYLVADFNLDGFVDGTDFIEWNANRFSNTGKWSLADANGDGFTDGADFIQWKSAERSIRRMLISILGREWEF